MGVGGFDSVFDFLFGGGQKKLTILDAIYCENLVAGENGCWLGIFVVGDFDLGNFFGVGSSGEGKAGYSNGIAPFYVGASVIDCQSNLVVVGTDPVKIFLLRDMVVVNN